MTTYNELYRKVLFRLYGHDASEGRKLIAAKEAVNDAHKIIARVFDYDDLIVTDTSSASTVASTATYHLIDDWSLTRPKDILTLRLMDDDNSRKLVYISPSKIDEQLPYPAIIGEERPTRYTQRGFYIELFPIPDDAYDMYIMYSQWPLPLSDDADISSYANANIDDTIISLGVRMAQASLNNAEGTNWLTLARDLLAGSTQETKERPDRKYQAQPFQCEEPIVGEYWKMPFVRRNP